MSINGETIKEKISEGISSAVDKVANEREMHYQTHDIPDKNEISKIIQNYSYKNGVISGGAGLIPGPWGMAAAIPEIIAVIKNQMNMIYDIAKAHGHKQVDKELIIAVLLGAAGNTTGSLFIVHGQKIMAKRVGASALQSIIKVLGGKVTQQVAKSMAAKWIPVAGAIAMATWSKYTTNKIGDKAIEVFSKDIVYDETELTDIAQEDLEEKNTNITPLNQFTKIKIESLINLMKIDGMIDDKEVTFIEGFINKSDLSNEEQMSLIEKVASNDKLHIDYSIFKENQDEGLYLLIDLIALAKVDDEFHIAEKMFIKSLGKLLEFSEDDIKELME